MTQNTYQDGIIEGLHRARELILYHMQYAQRRSGMEYLIEPLAELANKIDTLKVVAVSSPPAEPKQAAPQAEVISPDPGGPDPTADPPIGGPEALQRPMEAPLPQAAPQAAGQAPAPPRGGAKGEA